MELMKNYLAPSEHLCPSQVEIALVDLTLAGSQLVRCYLQVPNAITWAHYTIEDTNVRLIPL